MRLITSFAAASLALSIMAGPALAQQGTQPGTATTAPAAPQKQISPSHFALAKEVAVDAGITRSFGGVLEEILAQVRGLATTRPELKNDLDQILQSLQPELNIQQQQIINKAAQIFAENLSESELKDINVFFKSPAGMKYVQTQPQITGSLMQAFQAWSQSVGEYVMVRVRAELAKRNQKL